MDSLTPIESENISCTARSAATRKPAIVMDSISIRFDGMPILDHFCLHLAEGDKATLIGRSGCGKSTVLNALMGFVEPERGNIDILGTRLSAASVWELRGSLALVTQEPILGSGAVQEILRRPFEYKANAHLAGNLSRVPELFDCFLLPVHLLDKEITHLSGGEKQRVAIITALLLDRPIVLLDEASSALDPQSKRAVAAYFRERHDLTLLSVSHDEDRFRLSDRIINLSGSVQGGEA
ncbi:MAG: ABC transporter ATP-binding protein [Planctomycetota bacterium]